MARNTSFALGEHFQGFIEQRVAEGRYGSASEVVRAGLRLLEDYEAQVARLGEAILEGERSGPPEPMNFGEFAAQLRRLTDYMDQLDVLEIEIQKGVESGPAVAFDLDSFLAERHAAHGLK